MSMCCGMLVSGERAGFCGELRRGDPMMATKRG